uniref:CCHC-type domain-containing protein n=1 Tax=Arundo donax TaxID=35708 RepID=A0A0A9F9Q0_ARUDO
MSKSKEENKIMAHVKCSNMGHFASSVPNKIVDDKAKPSRKRSRINKRKCYGCNGKGHEIASCPHKKDKLYKSSHKRLTDNEANKKQDEKVSYKSKHRLCYNCREKRYIGKNCPKGNIFKPIPFNDHYLLRKAKSGTYVAKVISLPNANAKAIWVPKSYVTNHQGPNMVWVPKCA